MAPPRISTAILTREILASDALLIDDDTTYPSTSSTIPAGS